MCFTSRDGKRAEKPEERRYGKMGGINLINRLINFLIRWKLKHGTAVITFPYYGIDYWLYEIKPEDSIQFWIRRKDDK